MSAPAFTPVPGHSDYAASPDGRVWSVGTNWRGYGARPLETQLNRHGYLRVRLTRDGKRGWISVHRLIALTFLGPCPSDCDQVRHLDGDRTNNLCGNLAWGSAASNAADRTAHGTAAPITPQKAKAMLRGRLRYYNERRLACQS